MTVKPLGTLYVNGQPTEPGQLYEPGDVISFGDTVSGKELVWIPIPGSTSWVARDLALTNVSWLQLRDMKFVAGSPFVMDNSVCFVRLPKLGKTALEGSELARSEGPDDGMMYWGYETFINFDDKKKPEQRCAAGGGAGFHQWASLHPAEKRKNLGFRPVIDIGI